MFGKAEWWFYHLERGSLEHALGPLLEKCLERDWRVLVVGSEDRLAELDAGLWTWRDDSFLPHGRQGFEDARQPILLASNVDPANGAQAIVLLDGMDADTNQFERCMVVFHDTDQDTRAKAREQFKQARDSGSIVRYFQQNDRGGWIERT